MSADLFGDADACNAVPRLTTWAPESWQVHTDWQPVLRRFWQSPDGVKLAEFVQTRLAAGAVVYPQHPLWALSLTALADVRVVILGQDPYHGSHQAQGLAFSVGEGVKLPPSLRNIFKELHRDLQLPIPKRGSLEAWARRGVLLLNTSLTVEDGLPASHAKRGWEVLTDALLAEVVRKVPCCAYLLWGGHAQAKQSLIESGRQASGQEALVLTANHPSPLSALRPPQPFMGCGHFSQVQRWLAEKNQSLDWAL